jgi:hypothetical protein|tara:strand:- start:1796 stop:2179 length:384 start_codon:yes stop_codon:yes gene_type:complete
MSSFSDYLEDAVLNYVFRNTGTPTSTNVYLALYTVAPSDTGGGTEVSGAGYARQATAFDASSGGAITNTSAEEFTASGGTFGTVVAVGIFDAVTAGNLLAWDAINSTTLADGDKITFPIGDIDISLT